MPIALPERDALKPHGYSLPVFATSEEEKRKKGKRKGRVAPPWMFSQRNNPYCE